MKNVRVVSGHQYSQFYYSFTFIIENSLKVKVSNVEYSRYLILRTFKCFAQNTAISTELSTVPRTSHLEYRK